MMVTFADASPLTGASPASTFTTGLGLGEGEGDGLGAMAFPVGEPPNSNPPKVFTNVRMSVTETRMVRSCMRSIFFTLIVWWLS